MYKRQCNVTFNPLLKNNSSINFSQTTKINRNNCTLKEVEIMTEQESSQQDNNKKHMFPSLPENINYIENKLCHSDDIKN